MKRTFFGLLAALFLLSIGMAAQDRDHDRDRDFREKHGKAKGHDHSSGRFPSPA